jgi:hypothetical protein
VGTEDAQDVRKVSLRLGRRFVSASAIVELLSELVSGGDAEFERLHGAPALAVLYEVQAALMAAMESDLSYVVLWEQFLITPHEVDQALRGVIQMLMAADPVLNEWIEAALERYRQAAPPQSPL